MSRWFRHYAGMMRDEKLVRVSIRAKQPIERVVWIWGAILESAAEINDGGRFDIDVEEIAHFLRVDVTDCNVTVTALSDIGRVSGGKVANWDKRQYTSDDSTDRVRKHREKKKSNQNSGGEDRECNVSSPLHETLRNAPETETETETERKKDSLSEPSSDTRKRNSYSDEFEDFWKAYPTDSLMSKKQAFDTFKRLTPEDRAQARSAVPAFVEYCRKHPDYRPIHAVRFLSQRRFDGFAKSELDDETQKKIDADMAARGYVWRNDRWEKIEAA